MRDLEIQQFDTPLGQSRERVPALKWAALFASMVSACHAPEVDLNVGKNSSAHENSTQSVDDTAETKDPTEDSGEETGDTDDSADSGNVDSGDSGEAEAACAPHNTSAWPSTWSVELGASFRDNGGEELSGITGIPGASVDLPPQVIYGAGDKGILYEMDGNFGFLRAWTQSTPEDNEGIATDRVAGTFFTVDEDLSDVDEYSWLAGVDPQKSETTDCSLNIPADTSNNLGIEGFTYLPAEDAPAAWSSEAWADARGYLLAGSQTDATVGVFPVSLCTNDAVLDPVLSLASSGTDIAGLATLKGNLYVLHDSANTVDLIDLSTQVLRSTYTLPTDGQEEGIWVNLQSCDAVNGTAMMYVSDDVSGEIYGYEVPVDSAY